MKKKTIGIGILATLLVTIFGGIALTDDNVFYCESSHIAMQCDNLSKYYSLPNGKCWNEDLGNKLCKTGWLEVTNEETTKLDTKYIFKGRTWACESDDPMAICNRDGTHQAYRYQLN